MKINRISAANLYQMLDRMYKQRDRGTGDKKEATPIHNSPRILMGFIRLGFGDEGREKRRKR